MGLLFVHSDHLEFEVTSEAGPEGLAETEGVPMEGQMEDCLTVFVSVESADEADIDAVVANAAEEVGDVADLPQRPRYLPVHVSDHPNFTGR